MRGRGNIATSRSIFIFQFRSLFHTFYSKRQTAAILSLVPGNVNKIIKDNQFCSWKKSNEQTLHERIFFSLKRCRNEYLKYTHRMLGYFTITVESS